MLETVVAAPPDPILGLTDAFRRDPNPDKVNLGVGVYQDDEGRTPVLKAVKAAEAALLAAEDSKGYLPIEGDGTYGARVQELLFDGLPAAPGDRARTAHAPGGTGALRVAADFFRSAFPKSSAWISAPTWPNHRGILAAAGLPVKEYPYYDAAGRGLDAALWLDALARIPAGDLVVLHLCCHNPTGSDPDAAQWKEAAAIARRAGWLPLIDAAYVGFGDGIEADRAPLGAFLEQGVDLLVASSFSKNMGLYRERVGALTLVAATPEAAAAAFSQVKRTVRALYSNPPAHGGLVAARLLSDRLLRATWRTELDAMCARIHGVRAGFVERLRARQAPTDFGFIARQKGIFSFSGLTRAQVDWLREKKSIYATGDGRINVAGMTRHNIDYVCDAIVDALRSAR
jgi:aspartate aminotransferase/aromatic-amino-acid transaminase